MKRIRDSGILYAAAGLLLAAALFGVSVYFRVPEPVTQEPYEPESRPVPPPPPTEAVISAEMTPEEILAMGNAKRLVRIDASQSREYEALMELRELLPDCDIYWELEYAGNTLDSGTQELTATDLEGLEDALRFLPELKRVDLLSCGVSVEQMDSYSALRPDVDFLWTVSFGKWEVRSDITCFSTLQPGSVGIHRYTSEELYPLLRYCRKLRALDLGHNGLTDISLIGQLSELQVLIIGENPYIADLSPLANCKELMYIECFSCPSATDFSFLGQLPHIKDINASYNDGLSDISFLSGLEELDNVWLLESPIDWDMLKELKEAKPDVLFVSGSPPEPFDAMAYGWRSAHRNIAIRRAFANWRDVEEFVSWDDVRYREGSAVYGQG